MAANLPIRLAQLPGFDTAPDVYETADTDTTTSTLQTSPRAGPPSEASDTSEEDNGRTYGVSRRRLYPERARSRFSSEARGIEGKGVDLSDRVDGKRRGYQVRKRRGRLEGTEEDNEETLEGKVSRLKREVEECRVQAQAQAEKVEQDGDEDEEAESEEGEFLKDVDALSRLLAGVELPSIATTKKNAKLRGSQIFHDALPIASTEGDDHQNGEAGGASMEDQSLSKISAFDTRLSTLETALGISSILDPISTTAPPLLPTLTLLDDQLATITTATSLANLEAASARIKKLKSEAQQLSALHHQHHDHHQHQQQQQQQRETPSSPSSPSSPTISEANPAQVHDPSLTDLYTLLPTLQNLSPTLPLVLTRLRSLRSLHAAAASAKADLDALETRQLELDRESKMWREGLEKVENAVKEANAANGRNGNFVREWVEDLEGRMKGLGAR